MFQKTGNTPNKLDEILDNNVIYIPEGKQKINDDILGRQYFMNFIEPDYNISSQFSIRSRDDKRFQTRVDLLLEREHEMRKGTFNPLLYKQHIENNVPQNQVTHIYTPSDKDFNKEDRYTTRYPQTPANPQNRALDYMNLNNQDDIEKANRLTNPPEYNTNSNNIYHNHDTSNSFTPVIKYNNTLFSKKEKTIIRHYKLKQTDFDPLLLLNKNNYTLGSLLNKYKSFKTLYSPQSPIYSSIVRAIQQLLFIIKQS